MYSAPGGPPPALASPRPPRPAGAAPPRVATGAGDEALDAGHPRHQRPRLVGGPDRLHRRASQLPLRLRSESPAVASASARASRAAGRLTAAAAVERRADQRGRLAGAARGERDESGVVAGDREKAARVQPPAIAVSSRTASPPRRAGRPRQQVGARGEAGQRDAGTPRVAATPRSAVRRAASSRPPAHAADAVMSTHLGMVGPSARGRRPRPPRGGASTRRTGRGARGSSGARRPGGAPHGAREQCGGLGEQRARRRRCRRGWPPCQTGEHLGPQRRRRVRPAAGRVR